MASEVDASDPHEQESVVLASFEHRRAAERMLASLGRNFRKKARKGKATAFIVSGNSDGSLKITESRVLETSDFLAAVIRIFASLALGFLAIFSTLKGALGGKRAARKHEGHVGSDEQRAHEILAEAALRRPSHWFAARTQRCGGRSPRWRARATPAIAGMALWRTSSRALIRAVSTTGFALLSASPQRTADSALGR
ncbi:MAG: hypothetical protein ACRDKD_00865 [Solirubrobacteraceae bacterium]